MVLKKHFFTSSFSSTPKAQQSVTSISQHLEFSKRPCSTRKFKSLHFRRLFVNRPHHPPSNSPISMNFKRKHPYLKSLGQAICVIGWRSDKHAHEFWTNFKLQRLIPPPSLSNCVGAVSHGSRRRRHAEFWRHLHCHGPLTRVCLTYHVMPGNARRNLGPLAGEKFDVNVFCIIRRRLSVPLRWTVGLESSSFFVCVGGGGGFLLYLANGVKKHHEFARGLAPVYCQKALSKLAIEDFLFWYSVFE